MSNNSLASTYSRSLGLSLDEPFIYQLPYSLPFNDYIIIHNSSGNPCKNYDYFQNVVNFIKPYLENLQIVQLGGKDDIGLEDCYNLCGRTNIHQTAYLIKNAKLLIGNDSQLVHIAGALKTPVIGLYGPTSIECHGPHWYDKFIGIESHRDGNLPSYRFDENPKTINFIEPEEVAQNILNILNINQSINIKTLFKGPRYNDKILEVVLDQVIHPSSFPNVPLNIRYDYLENPDNLVKQLNFSKCLIVTNKNIDIKILEAFKQNILGVIYDITENNDSKFANSVRKVGINLTLISKLDEEELNKYKIGYFDLGIINQEKKILKEEIKNYQEIDNDTYFLTNKVLLANNKAYSSKSHWLLDIPKSEEEKIIDTPKFWEESDYFYLYKKA